MSTESDWKAVELSFDLLEDAEIVQEFEDTVWLKVDKATWYEFIGNREPLDDTFNPGARQDWEPRLCGEVTIYGPVGGELKVQRWAIFNVKTGREWKDADGDYLSFDYEAEAQAYLNGFFDAWKGAK